MDTLHDATATAVDSALVAAATAPTTPVEPLTAKAQAYLDAIGAPGVAVINVVWESDVKPRAAHKGRTLRKVTSALAMTGVEYAKLAVNVGQVTGPLPWGHWIVYPYIIGHGTQQYARLYAVDNTLRTTYYVDGAIVKRADFLALLTDSAAKATPPNGGCISVKVDNLTVL